MTKESETMRWKMKLLVGGLLLIALFVSCEVGAQEKSIAEQAGEWIQKDNERRGYTGMEETQMYVTVYNEFRRAAFVDIIAERLSFQADRLPDTDDLLKRRERVSQQALQLTANCTVFHEVQRDLYRSQGVDGSSEDRSRTAMTNYFIYTARAVGQMYGKAGFDEVMVKMYNEQYAKSYDDWTNVSSADDEASTTKSNEMTIGCARLAIDYDQAWDESKTRINNDAVIVERDIRLKALVESRQ